MKQKKMNKIYPNDYKNNDPIYNLFLGILYGSLCSICWCGIIILIILLTKTDRQDSSESF